MIKIEIFFFLLNLNNILSPVKWIHVIISTLHFDLWRIMIISQFYEMVHKQYMTFQLKTKNSFISKKIEKF